MFEILIFIVSCVVSGIVAGMFGLGGGAVLVPMMIFVLPMFGITNNILHIAVATSLCCIIFTAISSSYSHFKRGGVSGGILKFWAPANLIGAIVGAFWTISISPDIIRIIYGIVMVVLCIYKYFNYNKVLFKKSDFNRFGLLFPAVFGWVSACIGIGGGNNVIGLNLFGFGVKKAIGTSAVLGLVVSVPSVIIYVYEGIKIGVAETYSFGFVNWLVVLCVIPITTVMAPVGVKLAYKISERILIKFWCLLSLSLSLYMLSGLF